MKKGMILGAVLMLSWVVVARADVSTNTNGFVCPCDEVLFCDDFNGYCNTYDFRNSLGGPWYAGRFECPDSIASPKYDVHVGSYNGNKYIQLEDDAGILVQVNTLMYTDVRLSFSWKTSSTDSGDTFRAGYLVGDLFAPVNGNGILPAPSSDGTFDFYGAFGQTGAEAWWQEEWTEVACGRAEFWQDVCTYLPQGEESVWVAFWLDNGECDYANLDCVKICGTLVPEPATVSLLGLGIGVLLVRRFRKR